MKMVGVICIGAWAENGLERATGGCAEGIEKSRASAFGVGLFRDIEFSAIGQSEAHDVEGVPVGVFGKFPGPSA